MYGNSIGMCRDDVFAISNNTPRKIGNIKKNICKIFNKHYLELTTTANRKKVVDLLDVTLHLNNSEHKPFSRRNSIPRYVHKMFNHPPYLIKNIPKSINKHLSVLPSDKAIFETTKCVYQLESKKS